LEKKKTLKKRIQFNSRQLDSTEGLTWAMFAVRGWAVSATNLKPETGTGAPTVANNENTDQTAVAKPRSKKRKRRAGATLVTGENVADLWESVIEGKKKPAGQDSHPEQGSSSSKRHKKSADKSSSKDSKPVVQNEEDAEKSSEKGKKKEKKRKNSEKLDQSEGKAPRPEKSEKRASVAGELEPPAQASAAAQPAPAALTPLQASMRNKLISARFRHLNETLYTRPSKESFQLFTDSPEMFSEYHEGFRRQVEVWPENPIDGFLEDVRHRAKHRFYPKGRQSGTTSQPPISSLPLPRTDGLCTLADLGCGDAQLSEKLQPYVQKLRLNILSYDLQSPSRLVTKADIANLPLADGSVNVAIFCLALMGTNWLDFIEEAYRILHWKGELWIAEIKSRFGRVSNKHAPVAHSVGNRRKPQGKKAKAKGDAAEDAANEEHLAVEVDGQDDLRNETDVSAFVEALQKRGFLLQGERDEAVDLSNRMFVKMHFIKAAPPIKGKGVVRSRDPGAKKLFLTTTSEDDDASGAKEATILKPCVYKLR
jgi:ribosomal RNA-processing protein 8